MSVCDLGLYVMEIGTGASIDEEKEKEMLNLISSCSVEEANNGCVI